MLDKAGHLRLRDLREAFRLIGECRELGRDQKEWRLHMLEGLRRMTGARVALYLHLHDPGSGEESITEPLDAGFLEPSHRALWAQYQRENAHRDDPFHRRYYDGFHGPLHTRALAGVVNQLEWRRSRHYNEYIRACDLDDRITSSLRLGRARLPAREIQVIVLHRSAGDGPYPLRALRLVRVFPRELAGLLGRHLSMTTPDVELGRLPGQLRQVLVCLLQGDAEKEIACRLGISRHTVNRHVQRLYRRLGVHSRGELTFRCRDILPLVATESAGGDKLATVGVYSNRVTRRS